MNSFDTDVLIAGAGPTGLMLAAQLERSGVRFRIIDKEPVRPESSRAFVVHARSLELLQKLGVADDLVQAGRTTVRLGLFIDRRLRAELELADIGVDDSPYPFLLFVSQVETERALERALRARVERPVELLDYVDDGEVVTARLSGGETIRARYLAGCDGAHSVVRHGTGLQFKGAAYPQDFILADVHIDWDRPDDQLVIFLARKGLIASFPFGGGLVRLIASRAQERASRRELRHAEIGAGQQADDQPKLEEFDDAFARFTPFRPRLHDPKWLARFRLHHRVVERYSKGRVFLAGDAAHIHSPVGGQGMNTGIQDAANLGWKLAMVIRGDAAERLLESYDAERRPIGNRLLHFTDRAFAIATIHTPVVADIRDFLVGLMAPRALRSRDRRRRAFRFVSQLAIRYDKSPIVGPNAGWRAPDAPLVVDGKETTIFELTRRLQHHLLIFDDGAVRIDEVDAIDARGMARERYGVKSRACFLIRPDGYVAFRSEEPAEARAFLQRLR